MNHTLACALAATPAFAAAAQDCGWLSVGGGLVDRVFDLVVHEEGGHPWLIAGGVFEATKLGVPARRVARWDGAAWSALGDGLPDGDDGDDVRVVASVDLGAGPVLYAGGTFQGEGLSCIAAWDGQAWRSLGPGLNERVRAIRAFDEDGDGPLPPALFVAGQFTATADGSIELLGIARWDGASWSAVGGGLTMGRDITIGRDLLVFDDDGPGGPNPLSLFVTGDFTAAGGAEVGNIARWDGLTWTRLGDGVFGDYASGICLAAWDDGAGPALYVGGGFSQAGGQPVSRVARWDGAAWSALGQGIAGNYVRRLVPGDDGRGPALFASGLFYEAGGEHASCIARWDGQQWSALTKENISDGLALLATDRFGPGRIVMGGNFTEVDDVPGTSRIAAWACTPTCGPADCSADGVVDLFDFLCFINTFNAGDPSADCVPDGSLDLFDFLCFVNAFNAGC